MSSALRESELEKKLAQLPPDPSFPPSAYRRTSLLLRSGVATALILFAVALFAYVLENPSLTLNTLIANNPLDGLLNLTSLFQGIFQGTPAAFMTLAILVLVATTIGRVLLAASDLFGGRERVLAWVSVAVLAMLLFGLFVVGPLVR